MRKLVAGEAFFAFTCSPDLSALVEFTDLVGWWSGQISAVELQRQLEAQDVDTSLEEILALLCSHYDGEDAEWKCFQAHWDGAGLTATRTVVWEFSDVEVRFAMAAAPAPAALLRDRLLLPVLRAAEQLRRMLPRDAAWKPPAAGGLPLPSLRDPLFRQLFAHGDGEASASRAAAVPVVSEPAAGSVDAAGAAAGDVAAAGEAGAATSVLSTEVRDPEAERQKRMAAERERKAAKAKAKAAGRDGGAHAKRVRAT